MPNTTLPQHPQRSADTRQQVWTVWTMLLYFLNGVYDPQIANILAQIAAITGGGTVDKNFVYNQVSASNTWTVPHNLNKYPAISVVDSGGTELVPDVVYVDVNHVTISFAAPTSGKVYCN